MINPSLVNYSKTQRLRVAHTIAGLELSGGGPTQSVLGLCGELGKRGHEITLFTLVKDDEAAAHALIADSSIHLIASPRVKKPRSVPYSRSFRHTLVQHCLHQEIQLLHDNGLWLPNNHVSAGVAQYLRIPLVISPHGMLEPWALNYKAWKKHFAWHLYQKRNLNVATLLHATSVREAENFRQLGFKQPIAIIPNGVELPQLDGSVQSESTSRKLLFLSRIHPVKGLLNLVQAWQIAKPNGWKMVIAGPDEGGYQKIVEDAVRQAGLQEEFEFFNPVYGDAKFNLYRSAELFVLPTFTENFGLVVAEALASGVPVITTKGAPWEALITNGCGWWIDIGAEPLAAALREASRLPSETLRKMGQRGRAYVEENLGWPSIARQMLSVYRWILNQGPQPDCVILD